MPGEEKSKKRRRGCKSSIPSELTNQNRWIAWALRYIDVNTPRGVLRQPRVMPYRPHTKQLIPLRNVADPNNWTEFCYAQFAVKKNPNLDGPGFVNTLGAGVEDQTYVMVVLHNAKAPNGSIKPWAATYITLADTYAEEGFVPGTIVLLFRGKRYRKAARFGSVYVYSPPFLALTGRKLSSAKSVIRWVGEKIRPQDRQSRFERILALAEESYRRHREQRRERLNVSEQLGAIFARLGSIHTLGTNIYAAQCPGKKEGILIIHRIADRLHLGCLTGPWKPSAQELAEALGIEYDPEHVRDLDPNLIPYYQSLKDRLFSRAQVTYEPLQGKLLRSIHRMQDALKSLGRLPRSLEGTPLTYEDALTARMGYKADTEGAVFVFHDPERHIIYAQERYLTRSGNLRVADLVPGKPVPSWISPDFTAREDGILIVEGLIDAVLANNLLAPSRVAVVGVPTLYHNPIEEFLRALPPTTAYLYPGPGEHGEEERLEVAKRWAKVASAAGHTPMLIPILRDPTSGVEVSLARYAQATSRNQLLDALLDGADQAPNPLTEEPVKEA